MFTFQQLDDSAKLKGLPPQFCVSFLGEDTFKRWYPSLTVTPTATVPRQVARFLWVTLQKIREQLETEKTVRAEAAASFAVLIEQHEVWATSAAKKHRAAKA